MHSLVALIEKKITIRELFLAFPEKLSRKRKSKLNTKALQLRSRAYTYLFQQT